MRPIDADALKDKIRKYANEPSKIGDRRWDTRCTAIIADMNGLINNAPTVGGWISVEDDEDLISRAAALAEIEDYIEEYSDVDPETGLHNPKWCAMEEAKDVLVKLPAAHKP